MSYTFCTISSFSHLYKSFALADSLAPWGGHLNILLVDGKTDVGQVPKNVSFFTLDQLDGELTKKIIEKYKKESDKLRWSLKSVFLLFLLEKNEQAIYVDNDIHFFGDFRFLFEELAKHPILLTAHNYPRDPEKNQNWLEANFRVGLYNAGFVACNQKAKPSLIWWAKACLYRCEKNYWRGLFDDQKYLDLFPVIEPQTKVLTHLGCNVAEWNSELCYKTEIEGKFFINQKYPLIFYHFNFYSLKILGRNHPLFSSYFEALKEHKKDLQINNLIPKENKLDYLKLRIWKILNWWNG
ncbi:MAG: hypothetical protein H6579_04825 [Chitinophagales bacterium]|nr:hypothetical protein [Chitinophagales bacterium]